MAWFTRLDQKERPVSDEVLELKNVVKEYPAPSGSVRVLDDICLSIVRGQSLAIVGPSGSGKSTLLNLLAGLDRPTSGQVLLDGHDISSMSHRQQAAMRRKRIGIIFQMHHLLPQCSALENVLVPTLAGNQNLQAPERAVMLLERVGLAERMHHRACVLSGGECQRVALARALINQPAILLADEPTGSLDADSQQSVAELLLGLKDVSVVMVTHSQSLADRVGRTLRLHNGQLELQK